MPLRGTENEVANGRSNGHIGQQPGYWTNWPSAIDRLWSRRRHILGWMALGILMSLGIAYLYPKYESTVQIMPPDSSSSGLSLALPAVLSRTGSGTGAGSGVGSSLAGLASELLGMKNSTAVFMKVLDSRTVQDDLINDPRFDLRKRYHLKYMEDTRQKLHSRTSIAEDKKSGVIALSVRDHDPRIAQELAQAYIDELDRVVARVSTSSARREREFIEQRLADEKKVLDEAEQQFGQFASSTMALDVPEQTKTTVEAAARLQGEIIAARSELEGLEQVYTKDNYRVKARRARVAELERELNKINSGPIPAGADPDPANPYPSVKSLPKLGVQWVDLYRNTKIHETVFALLTQQYELAKIQEAKEIPTVKVLDSPSVPERRYPAPALIVELGTMLALGLGCFSVFLQDRWDNWNVEDPRRLLLQRMYYSATAVFRPWSRPRHGRGNGSGHESEMPGGQPEEQEQYSERRS